MTDQDRKIADLELEIKFFKNEMKKANLVNNELTKQLALCSVGESFYCDDPDNTGHCRNEGFEQCKECKLKETKQ